MLGYSLGTANTFHLPPRIATEGQDAASIDRKLFLLLSLELKVKTRTQDDRSILDLSLWTMYNSVIHVIRDECELFLFQFISDTRRQRFGASRSLETNSSRVPGRVITLILRGPEVK